MAPADRSSRERTFASLPVVVIAAAATIGNLVVSVSTYPALGILSSLPLSIAVVSVAGALAVAGRRFPASALVLSTGLFMLAAVAPSLVVAGYYAGRSRDWVPKVLLSIPVACAIGVCFAPWLPLSGVPLALLLVALPFAVGTLTRADGAARLQLADRLTLAEGTLDLSKRQAAMAERERMSDELHDRLGHQLSAIEIQARLLDPPGASDPVAAGRVAVIREHSIRALDSLRTFVGSDQSTPLDSSRGSPGRIQEIDTLLVQVRARAADLDVPMRLRVQPAGGELVFDASYTLLRLAEECVTNIARHAPGMTLELDLSFAPDRVTAVFANDRVTAVFANDRGTGNISGSGRGLAGMRRRAEELGGTLKVATTEDRFQVTASIPRSAAGGEA